MYFHPWEIDPEQPRLPAKPRTRFRQYTGLRTTEWKLKKLLAEFAFAPIETVFEKELRDAQAASPVPQGNGEGQPANSDTEEACLNAATRGGDKWSS